MLPTALRATSSHARARHASPLRAARGAFLTDAGGPTGLTIVVVAGAAFALKLWLAASTYGTNDMYRWEAFAAWSKVLGVGIYRAVWDFNHPAAMLHFLGAIRNLSEWSGLPFAFWLRLPAILADLGGLWVVWTILGARRNQASIGWALVLLAAAPPLILVSGFHGNTDPIMIFFLLAAVLWTERETSALAGAAFGLAMSVKVVPLIALPALVLLQSGRRRRVVFLAAAAAIVLVTWSPYLFQDPRAIAQKVVGYRSLYGQWGLSFLLHTLAGKAPWLRGADALYLRFGAFLALGAVLAVSLWMNRSQWIPGGISGARPGPDAFSQVGLVFLLFLSLSSGFGVQYLVWIMPWVVGLGFEVTGLVCLTSSVFLFLVYDFWSHGFPWYLADSNLPGSAYPGHFDAAHALCWLSVVGAAWIAWSRVQDPAPSNAVVETRPRAWRVAAALIVVVVVLFPLAKRWSGAPASSRAGVDALAVELRRSEQRWELASYLLNGSLAEYRAGRFEKCITAAKAALALRPDWAEAHNNLAAAYAGLRRWDDAIRESSEALRLKPDFQLARNNLAWALKQRSIDAAKK